MRNSIPLALGLALLTSAVLAQDPEDPDPIPVEGDGVPEAPATPDPGPAATPEDAPPAASSAIPRKASLAVMPFGFRVEVLEHHSTYLKLAIKQFSRTGLTNKFVGALVNSRKFDVIERQKMDTVLDEMSLSDGGFVDPARAVKAGKVIGADYFLMGEISVFNVQVLWKEVPYSKTGKTQRIVRAHIVADMRIVDTRTSKIVAADKGEATWKQTKMFPNRFEDAQLPPDLVDTLQRQLCDDLVERTVDRVYPVKIIGNREGTFFLNRGKGGGLKVGQILDVYQQEDEAIVDLDTGEALGFNEVKLGQLRVTEIFPRMTGAVAHSGAKLFPKGSICRKPKAAPASRPVPARRKPPGW